MAVEPLDPIENEDDKGIVVEVESGEEQQQKPEQLETQQKPEEQHEELTDEQKAEEANASTDEEREAIRERRRQERQERKNYRKEKEESYKREIDALRRQVSEMNEWKNTVETRRVHTGIGQLDKAIKDSYDAVETAKQAIREATASQDGDALVDAQELYYVARKRIEDLSGLKQRIVQQAQTRPVQNIDQAVVNNAKTWMENKSWYDPTGRDPDSRIALTIDNAMAEEGWDPRNSEYWSELDNRLKKYLPHRYNSGYTAPNKRAITGGSSGTTNSQPRSNEYRLSAERVRAMKEAGMWDDPDKRKRMIQRYMEMDKKGA